MAPTKMMPNNTPTTISVTLPPPELGAMTLIDMRAAVLVIVLVGKGWKVLGPEDFGPMK
jgi:hypothetical protein